MVDPTSIVIRHATPDDAASLAELAARTFHDTFAATNDAGDMAIHLARAYGSAQQSGEIRAPGARTLLASTAVAPDALIAFAQLRTLEPPPPCVETAGPVEIWRFYVDRPWHGRGVAHLLMQQALAEASAAGAGSVWLGVWEHNPRARAFYRKFGFIEVGAHDFLFGTDPQTDLVLVRPDL